MRLSRLISPQTLGSLAAAVALLAPFASARVDSDIAPPEKRKVSVDNAVHLSRLRKTEALPAEINNSFAPPQFDLTDAEEAAAAAAAARLAAGSGGPAAIAAPTDRELLESIVSKIAPSGTVYLGGKPMLMFGKRFVKTGAHFTVTYKGIDYDLELTDIDGANFTLRYNHEEITRPVKTGKSP